MLGAYRSKVAEVVRRLESGVADDAAELARLDERIAANDAQGTPNAEWRAADAVYHKAKLIRRLEGDDAALPLYADVVRRLEGRLEPGGRELLICALNSVAVVHHCHGRAAQSRAAAEALVDGHLDDGPLEAAEAVANATLLLSRLRSEAGEFEKALDLLERLIGRYGQPGVPDHRRTSAFANAEAASILGEAGRFDEGLRRWDRVIEELGDPVELELQRVLAEALTEKALLLNEKNLPGDRDAVCRLVLERFDGAEDPEIAEHVRWARMVLDEDSTPSLGRHRRWRREAEAAYREAIAAGKTDRYFSLAYLLAAQPGREEEAEAAYREAIAAGDKHAPYNLGLLLAKQPGRDAEAEAVLREAIAAGDTDAWYLLGRLLAKQRGREQEAEAAYREAIDCAHGRVLEAAAVSLGELLAGQGDLAGAHAAFEMHARAFAKRWECDLSDSTIARTAHFKTAVARRPGALRLMRLAHSLEETGRLVFWRLRQTWQRTRRRPN